MIAFGPVPSRRLGRSLGINNIPPKVCTYSCVYCQVGKTSRMQVDRMPFYDPEKIYMAVRTQVAKARQKGESVDYLTFVPDGEPTLDVNLGNEIELLKSLGLKIAVITNGALAWRKDVKADLAKADWVSYKIDSTSEKIWRRINRPQRTLRPGQFGPACLNLPMVIQELWLRRPCWLKVSMTALKVSGKLQIF